MIWLLLAVGCGSCLLGYCVGGALNRLDDDESLVAAFFADLAITEQELAEERERADELAACIRDLLDGTGDEVAAIDQADAALRAHDGAHR